MSFSFKVPHDPHYDAWRAEQAAEWARRESAAAAHQRTLKDQGEPRKDDLDRD